MNVGDGPAGGPASHDAADVAADDADAALDRIAGLVRAVPDFPEPGIVFRDITPVLADGAAFTELSVALGGFVADADLVVGVEARGFLLGAAAALVAGVGIVPVRKAGKLPRVAASRTYDLEYGTATLELPADAVAPGTRVVVVDDVLATGGTAVAACDLVAAAGGVVLGFAAMIELEALGGRVKLGDVPVHALLRY